jgi:7tm Odorant receptor
MNTLEQLFITIQVILKILVFNVMHMHLSEAVRRIEEFHETKSNFSDEHREKLVHWARNISCIIFVTILLFGSLSIAMITSTALAENSLNWFLFFTFNGIIMFGLQLNISAIVLFASHMFIAYKSMTVSIEQINTLIQQNSKDEKIEKSLATVVDDYGDLIEFMKAFNKVYSLVYFVEFLTMIMCIATFLTELSIHPEQIGDALALSTCLLCVFCSCLLASLIEEQHDKYFTALIQLDWLKLPLRQQKMVLVMLTASEYHHFIRCGTWEYNLKMFVSMCQSGYSYFNILLTFRQ